MRKAASEAPPWRFTGRINSLKEKLKFWRQGGPNQLK
jgi:hypothetical protein